MQETLQEILVELKAIKSFIANSTQKTPSVKRAKQLVSENKKLPLAKSIMVAQEKDLILETIKQLNDDNIVATRKSICERSGINMVRTSNRLQSLVSDGLVDGSGMFESKETAHKVQAFAIRDKSSL